MEINYFIILVGGVISMVLGMLWYGPLFGKKWLDVIGASDLDIEARKKMQKNAMPLYFVQLALVFFQITVLSYFVQSAEAPALKVAFLVWAGFVAPTLAGVAMWNNDSKKVSWARFLIQVGYQLALFIIFGTLLVFWG